MERARTLALPLVAVLACGRVGEAQASRAHVVVGALVPASGGILRPVPLVGAQLGLRTPLLGRTNVMAGVAQLRCRTGGCADPTLLSADMGFERLLVRFPLRTGPALFAEGGGGGRWYRGAPGWRAWTPTSFVGAGAEFRDGRAGLRLGSRVYQSGQLPTGRGVRQDAIVSAALSYHF